MTEDVKEILLNSSNSKTSVNRDISLDIDVNVNEKKFPANSITTDIDQYKQYIKEKDASNKYRFVFTINSVCSNVLYNHVTEITENIIEKEEREDSDEYKYSGYEKRIESWGVYTEPNNNKYVKYKYDERTRLEPNLLIRDTGYSHPKCGNLKYMPGIDIFNNHRFRNKEFVVVADKNLNAKKCENYNTISDDLREYDGNILQTIATSNESNTHLYYKDTFRTYTESIQDNLIERDGWFGFANPTSIDIPNCSLKESSSGYYECISINKVINNRKACEFIDLYPDRTLFSFVPNKNKLRNREEYNWDYCITYPYRNFYNNKLVSLLVGDSDTLDDNSEALDSNNEQILNGMLTEFCDSQGNKLSDDELNELLSTETRGDEFSDIMLCTKIKNNIKSGDYIKVHLVINNSTYFSIRTDIKVRNVGIGGYNTMYYFTVNKGDILPGLKTIYNKKSSLNGLYCYVQRVVNGRPCKYYFRKFRRLPNFKNTNVYNDGKLSNDAIQKVIFNDFNSSLNKLGFGTNVYGDRMAQIVYSDDVDTSNIYDNLGRPLHELFLTIIKTNRGNNIWYEVSGYYNESSGEYITYNSGRYSSPEIEYSHCFSDITSGLDMPWPYRKEDDCYEYDNIHKDDYNVHKIHNVEISGDCDEDGKFNRTALFENMPFPKSVEPLEIHLTRKGSSTDGTSYYGTFLGDIVELDELNVEEYVLEDVCHRFNTMQREYTRDKEFSTIKVDEIESDDYDGQFNVSTKDYLNGYFINLAPEGYYYKAHYRIPIREFSEIVNEGQHIIVKFDSLEYDTYGENFSGTTDKNYYFQKGDDILVYDEDKKKYVCTITNVSGSDFREIEFTSSAQINNMNNAVFFKPNPIKPPTAYDFDDGSGIYKWRDIESFEFVKTDSELYDGVFTNGAHYIHKNINFFLRRQDPYGLYGLNPTGNDDFPYEYQLLEQPGNEKDITPAQHFTDGDIQLC